MKKLSGTLAIVILTTRLLAQSNAPARLALIAETDEASAASDVLTAQLSGNQKIQLLERNEIEKVYREQALSAGNKDYLKLGRILGADGLLLFDVVRTPQATNLTTRLIAVKPGVVLLNEDFPWPLKDVTGWVPGFVNHLNPFLPKLSVLVKDAIPISIVNLRSAVQSAEAQETERQLKLLTIQRLSQEPQFFVLERQRMQLLSEEKALKTDDSEFWNGSYLLEGVVDQNGYDKDVITINARLTPPKGGVPMQFEVSGSRTNLAEVINQLAMKVNEALKISSTVKEWNTTDEAAQYFDEAKWALRWGVLPEAQAAADSAWALGKRDVDCALTRVKSYLSEVVPDTGGYAVGEEHLDDNASPNLHGQLEGIKTMLALLGTPPERLLGLTSDFQECSGIKNIRYVSVGKLPDPRYINRALHELGLYQDFSRTLPADEPKAGSPWYLLGIESLETASRVLQHFHFIPDSQKGVEEQLAELRHRCRETASWLSRSPSVHDSYFTGNRIANHDDPFPAIETRSIYKCELDWGSFWQDKPEDCVALYRNLMNSPIFCCLHDRFWLRELQNPRITAWNMEDRRRGPLVWENFVRELSVSTNLLFQLEAQSLMCANARDDATCEAAFTTLFDTIIANRSELVSNPVELLYWNWYGDRLLNGNRVAYIETSLHSRLAQRYFSEYRPKLEAMDREYWDKTIPSQKLLSIIGKQKQYLQDNKNYEFFEFANLFSSRNYTQSQAREIQPLLAAYKSNLVAQSQNASEMQKRKLRGAIAQVGFLENDVKKILDPPAPQVNSSSRPPASGIRSAARPIFTNAPETVTNVIQVKEFLAIPLDGLEGAEIHRSVITAHHWQDGKLVLDFQYSALFPPADANRTWEGPHTVARSAIALLDPITKHWEVVGCPEATNGSRNNYYNRTVLLHGNLFNCDGGQIRKYNFQKRQWQVLDVSDDNNYELFTVNGGLYAADRNTIFEIMDEGKTTRILASNRRRPSTSLLDTEELGRPVLFAGLNHSLRVILQKPGIGIQNKIFTWADGDWREDSQMPSLLLQPEIFPEGVLFRNTADGFSQPMSLSFLATETNIVELCFWQKMPSPNTAVHPGFYGSIEKSEPPPKALWKLPPNLILANLATAVSQSEFYLLVDHSEVQNIFNGEHVVVQQKVLPKDGYNAALLCFSRDLTVPQKLLLKFDTSDEYPPVTGIDPGTPGLLSGRPPAWLLFATNFLFCGLEQSGHSWGGSGIPMGYRSGIWLILRAGIDSALAIQKQSYMAQLAQENIRTAITREQRCKELMIRYDRNHNSVLDPDEKEAALDDPSFIESELDVIDANHNGWLDAAELVYFDANQNKILEPKEQAGIEITQHLLAERLLKKFDANGDGFLDWPEFNDLLQSSMETSDRSLSLPLNHDRHVDLGELETFLKQQTSKGLHLREMPGAGFFNPIRPDANQPVDPRQIFKAAVESYWQNPGGITNRPSLHRRVPPGMGIVTNETRSGKIP